ncbi:MAG: Txe/YoeB family addiction module toxin [Defluviitaleaceae bacterium]|nr:Txe/YoeB family addiction module toxin [Defluviitaleaceae bacterium]MCL2263505.1 Txe/YoeB family addiction module toxin [Defluviitaleaceae bacterium]MCL2263928.1 Txe/YoeB family addiction module toxin [Defluviitaleaceae bacterium]
MGYKLKYTPQANKDARLLERAGLDKIAKKLLSIISENPWQYPPAYEKLQGDMKGSYSRRINKQHRIVYDVLPNDAMLEDENGVLYKGVVKIIRMWTHYE